MIQIALGLACGAGLSALATGALAAIALPPPIPEGATCWGYGVTAYNPEPVSHLRVFRAGQRVAVAHRNADTLAWTQDSGLSWAGGYVRWFGHTATIGPTAISLPGHASASEPFRGPIPCDLDRNAPIVITIADDRLIARTETGDVDLGALDNCAETPTPVDDYGRHWVCGVERLRVQALYGDAVEINRPLTPLTRSVPRSHSFGRVFYAVPAWRVAFVPDESTTAIVATAPDGATTTLATIDGACRESAPTDPTVVRAAECGANSRTMEVTWSDGRLIVGERSPIGSHGPR